ncbi:MAG: LLM class flavin-dependent oxidoreductase [Ilumatobacteraceae bacterium]
MSDRLSLHSVGAYARRVESLGFDVLHIPETIHDSMAVALLALEHTDTLRIQTSLTLAFPRSPMLLALQSWDLSRMSDGRFGLGLGTQIRQNIEGRFGVPWTDPIVRMEDYVHAVRACWRSFQTGEPLRVDTTNYRLDRLQPFFSPGPLPHDGPEVLLGGVNPRSVDLAGRCADWYVTHPTNSHPRFLTSEVIPRLHDSSRARSQPPVVITAASPLISGPTDADVQRSMEEQRAVLAFLYSTPAYRRTLELFDWSEVGRDLQTMTRTGEWDRLRTLLTDDMMTTLLPLATWLDLPRVLAEWFGGLAQALVLQPPDPMMDRDDEFRNLVSRVKQIS